MSDTSTNPAEKPVNDGGGGNAPQTGSQPTDEPASGTTTTQEGSD